MKGNSKIEKYSVENILLFLFFFNKFKFCIPLDGQGWRDLNMTQLKVSSLSWKTSLDVIVFML